MSNTQDCIMKLREQIPGIDIEQALVFCMGSEEFYLEVLGDYCNSGRVSKLDDYFNQKDWDNYRVEVHGLKSTSRTVGLMELGSAAEKLEMACKEGNFAYVEENHLFFAAQVCEIMETIKGCI